MSSNNHNGGSNVVSGIVFGTVAMLMTRYYYRRQESSSEDLLCNIETFVDDDDDYNDGGTITNSRSTTSTITARSNNSDGGEGGCSSSRRSGGGGDRDGKYFPYNDVDEHFVQTIPKIELHVHLDGSFDPIQLWEYLQSHPELIMCLPISKVLPWNQTNTTSDQADLTSTPPPLRVREMITNCNTSNDYRKLCTCRRRYRSLRQQQQQLSQPQASQSASSDTALDTTNSGTTTHNVMETLMSSTTKQQQQHRHDDGFKKKNSTKAGATLEDMLTCFEFFLPLVQNNYVLLENLAYDFVKRQYEQNVIYTEVRYSPHYFSLSSPEKAIESVTRGLQRGCQKYNTIIVKQILCAINFNPEWSNEILQLAIKYRAAKDDTKECEDDGDGGCGSSFGGGGDCGVVGIDIASGEDHFNNNSSNPTDESSNGHYHMCVKAKNAGINITIHAGETPNSQQNVITAIKDYNARRIGHGYRIVNYPTILEFVKSNNVHIEVCPTSSVETGGWDRGGYDADDDDDDNNSKSKRKRINSWMSHPANMFRKYDISQSLSSDDPAVFNTSLTWQYRISIKKMGWTHDDIIKMSYNAIEASFAASEIKQQLRQRLDEWSNKQKTNYNQQQQHGARCTDVVRHYDLFHYNDRVHYE